jgi:hypothetical protein
VHTTHLPVAIDTNLLPSAPFDSGSTGLPSNGISFQDFGAPACVVNPAQCFADPTGTILQNNVYSSIGSADYNGGIFELKKRFSNHFTVLANYTYSKAIDDVTDFNSDYSPFNATNLKADRGLSDFDQRHKVVLSGVFDSPFEKSRIWGGRNTGLGPDFTEFDMRLSRSFKLNERTALTFTAEGFNIANHTNYASVNNVVGPGFAPPFSVSGSASLFPNQPLAFTSAFPARQVQLGLRLAF